VPETDRSPHRVAALPYLSSSEAADMLRRRRRGIDELVQDGRLPRPGDGRRLLTLRADVEASAVGRLSTRRGPHMHL
jgi:hypothetical protein